VLEEAGQAYVLSTAALRVFRRLRAGWPLLYAGMVIPKSWRDGVYSLVARHRHQWFGRPAECPVLPAEWRRRFIS